MTSSEMLDFISNASGVVFNKDAESNTICIDNKYNITFEVIDDNLFVMAEVAPATDNTELDRKLMQMNFLGIDTGGNTLSLDGRDNEYILHTIFYSGTTQEMLEGRLSRFFEVLRDTKKFVEDYADKDFSSDANYDPMMNNDIRI